ncbi:hypothetical protein [Turicibacter sp. TJ11]|uniref:hypothetical protein n=1 Tax=Turicibacter sp. TJ11 TaxID=2806443 RepID=UPI001F4529AF|nr:hypothetical protein [Turicibacter sp. TJ11]
MKNELIPYRQGKDLNYTEPVLENQITQKVKSELQRAWRDSILIDEKGWMWVKKNKLHSIIRTNKANAQFLVMRLSSEFKCNFNGELYIRGYKVLELLAKTIEENGAGKKGLNLEASKKFYDAINTCESVRLQRLEYDYTLNEARKKLKKKRRTKYKLTHDELTGEPLIIRSCEFSHIRSQAMYRELSDHIDNGLIVNKETHRLITERGINDENELLSFCKEQGWKTDWYDAYIHKFK